MNMRRLKRDFRDLWGIKTVTGARSLGELLATQGPRGLPIRLHHNPYPAHAKARRKAWDEGYRNADPHHGRNV